MRVCHFPSRLALLFATLALWPLSVVAQETCIGDQCTPQGSIYRPIQNLAVSGTVSANNVVNASNLIVNTVSELRKQPVPNGTTIFATRRGFNAGGDGGDATYASSPKSGCIDDGGACIAPTVGGGRWVLIPQAPLNSLIWGSTYPIQMYVATNGSDDAGANYCFRIAHPCKTPSQAVAQMVKFDLQGQTATIHIVAGTYADSPFCTGPIVGGIRGDINQASILFQGADDVGSTVIAGDGAHAWSIGASNGCGIGLVNLKLTATAASGQAGLYVQNQGLANVYQGNVFGAANGQQLLTEGAGTEIQIWNSFTISGGATYFALSQSSQIEFNPCSPACVVTLTGSPNYTSAWAGAAYAGYFTVQGGWSFSGSATGSQFAATDNGVVYNASGNTFPGSLIGTRARGGVYDPSVAPTAGSVTGLGTGGSPGAVAAGGAGSGLITLTTGSTGGTPAATGSVTLTFNTEIEGTTIIPGPCVAMPVPLNAGWTAGASVMGNGFGSNTITLVWSNGSATALPTSTTLGIEYVCKGY